MKFTIPYKKIFFTILLIGIVIYLAFFYHLINGNELKVVSAANDLNINAQASAVVESPLPVRLKIPTLNINAAIEYVGLTSDGAMDVPSVPMDVAWFDAGLRPGDVGSSVIDGHSGYKNNIQAVFDNLYKLKKGDNIYIEDASGATTSFVVSGLQNYAPNTSAVDVFSSSDMLAHLNLITCSGAWNVTDKTHSTRLVVFTDKVI